MKNNKQTANGADSIFATADIEALGFKKTFGSRKVGGGVYKVKKERSSRNITLTIGDNPQYLDIEETSKEFSKYLVDGLHYRSFSDIKLILHLSYRSLFPNLCA